MFVTENREHVPCGHKDAITVLLNVVFEWLTTPPPYSGSPRFDSRSRRPSILIQVFRGVPSSLQVNSGIIP
jgi:hypothetical protein